VLSIAAILSSVIGAYIYLKLILSIFNKDSNAVKIGLDWKSVVVICMALLLLFAGWMLIL
jgi:NADH:ubiquinone oxidoreductase subunit 2 (subunit N)